MTTGVFSYMDPVAATSPVKPWNKVDVLKMSFKPEEHQRSVINMRDVPESSIGTDISGFEFFNSPASEKDFTNDAVIREKYYPEVEALLREKLPGIKEVVVFDYTVRRREKTSPRQPVQLLHVDQTPWAAEARVRRHIRDPAQAEKLLKGRYQIINVWRPIGYPASEFPLAVIDWRSVQPEDLVKVDLMYPKRERGPDDVDDAGKEVLADPKTLDSIEGYEPRGELYVIAPNSGHRFFYVKDMTPEEAMFIKCFDSRGQGQPGGIEGVSGLAPHTAFVDPNSPADAKPRQSIEVRCLVFYE